MAKVLLVADDDEDVREIICLTLEDAGYDVLTAENGAAALAIVRSRRVDGLLTDVMMPRMTGFELADSVRLIRPELPIMTGYHEIEDVRVGAAFLRKPFRPNQLVATVERVVPAQRIAG